MARILIWYRTDLRIHDHEPLYRACRENAELLPVYCLDPRQIGPTAKTGFGFTKTGSHRAHFLLESLADLRANLRDLGSNLMICQGHPETVLPQLAQTYRAEAIYAHTEVGTEEQQVESALAQSLQALGQCPLKLFWGHTLLHPDDLPFPIHRIPEVFTSFRKKAESIALPRPLFVSPTRLPPLPANIRLGDLPTLADLGLPELPQDPRILNDFIGGETGAKARIQSYFWEQDRLKIYKETRNGMLNPEDSSKLSPWLALGCVSPRYVYQQVQQYEETRTRNDSTYWLVFELLWRDYFRLITAKHGHKLFRPEGLQGIPLPWQQDWPRFERWRQGETGYPLVDANMQELLVSGFMSNRGRQNVGSFLTKNLGIDWRMGAEWFESQLVDYDVCSNWGNWNYTAGVGNDARGFRYFNSPKQSREYDPSGDYLHHWLPALQGIPGDLVHEPHRLSRDQQKHFGVQIGVDYPAPMVDLLKSAKANEKNYQTAMAQAPL